MNCFASIADFLALRRNTSLLLVTLVLAGTGERLWLGFAPKYLETLGATVLAPPCWSSVCSTDCKRCSARFTPGPAAG
jgi:hypothetical protein